MQYRFYIYKQDISVANFNKYDLTQYVLLRQITNNAQWSLKIDEDKDFLSVKRTTFNGSISVDGADFTALIALEGSQLQYCIQIQEYCNKAWREKWKGFFSYFDYKVDRDNCQLSFTPSPFDIYTPVYDQMDIEQNVLVADADYQIPCSLIAWEREKIDEYSFYTGYGNPPLATWTEHPDGGKYYLYLQENRWNYFHLVGGNTFEVTKTYIREVGYSADNITPPGGGTWTPLAEVEPGKWKWVRPIGDGAYTTYTRVFSGHSSTDTLDMPIGASVTLIGMKRLNKVLEYFATFFNLTYASNFFYDTPNCPMGGNSLEWAMIQQMSNLQNDQDPATKGIMKLKDLLLWIRDTFNVYWYIDFSTNPLGNWRFEHRKFFDQGLSYTALTPVIELDLSLYPDNIRKLRRYEWSKPNLFRFEKLEIPYSYFTDWIYANIEYPQLSITGNDTKTVTVGWGTDIAGMYDSRAELPKQGWALYDCKDIAGVRVVNTVGAISGSIVPNGRFSTANLMRDLWGWGRLLPTGNVNGVATTFGSYEKLRKQVELIIPQCCQDLDYNGIFKTPLGNGLIDSAEYEAKTGNLKISLKYE